MPRISLMPAYRPDHRVIDGKQSFPPHIVTLDQYYPHPKFSLRERPFVTITCGKDIDLLLASSPLRLSFSVPDVISASQIGGHASLSVTLQICSLDDLTPLGIIKQISSSICAENRMFREYIEKYNIVSSLLKRLALSKGADIDSFFKNVIQAQTESQYQERFLLSVKLLEMMNIFDQKELLVAANFLAEIAGTEFHYLRDSHELIEALADQSRQFADRLHRQIDEILHAPIFQEYEARWRGLALLAFHLSHNMMTVRMLSISLDEFRSDLMAEKPVSESLLFLRLQELINDGTSYNPVTAVVTGYYIEMNKTNTVLLEKVALVAEMVFAPFFFNLAPVDSEGKPYAGLLQHRYKEEVEDAVPSPEWHRLRSLPQSAYLGLCLPRILGREPYGEWNRDGSGHDEGIVSQSQYLWVASTYFIGRQILRSFFSTGMPNYLCGSNRGDESLPCARLQTGNGVSEHRRTAEIGLDLRGEYLLSSIGLIPIIQERKFGKGPAVCLYSLTSLLTLPPFPEEEGVEHRKAGLDDLLLANRFIHCIISIWNSMRLEGYPMELRMESIKDWLLNFKHGPIPCSEESVASFPIRDFSTAIHFEERAVGLCVVDISMALTSFLERMDGRYCPVLRFSIPLMY